MRKFISTCMMLLVTISASAQFVVYQPVEVPSTTYIPVSMRPLIHKYSHFIQKWVVDGRNLMESVYLCRKDQV